MLRRQVLKWLAEQVPQQRLEHILRVEQMAIELARQHGVDQEKAGEAALLHDLAKYFKSQQLLEMAQQEGLSLDPVDLANPHLLHADVGAIVAREKFGVQDQEILAAIANHTLGEPGMSPLSCIIFLADTLESGRGDTLELDRLRELSHQDLDLAVWLTCDYTLGYLLENHRLIHPRALLTRNWFMQKAIA